MKFSSSLRSWIYSLAASLMLAACGGGGSGNGTMRVSLTDAPACGYDTVYVTVERVRVHRSATAEPGDSGWAEIVVSPARRIDLLSLTNGVHELLGQTQLPAGTYTQMRLVLAENGASAPFANAVTPTGGGEVPLDTPSGQQSGLKINLNVEVQPDQIADVVIDFDACKSVVRRGSTGRFNLKPVLSATTVLSDAGMRIVGFVAPAMAGTQTTVSVQTAGVPVRSTPPDSTGRFVLFPVPAGSYDLVVTSTGRVNAVMTGVPVTTTAFTFVNSETTRIDPPVSTTQRTVSGTVTATGGAAVTDAFVHALQTVSGTTFEAASQPVDAVTGAYSFTLPIEAPVKTAYVANPASLSFTADPAAAGRYRLEARAPGRTTLVNNVDLTSANVTSNFVFP
jgi:hypothetical protein